MDQGQFDQAIALPGEQRYQYFVSRARDSEEVWTLKGQDGFVYFATDETAKCKCFPFWPHPDHAAAVAVDMWADCKPERIDLHSFMAHWLPGIAKDNLKIAVFPTPLGTSVIVEPEMLIEDLHETHSRPG